jgi:hypothetical protein
MLYCTAERIQESRLVKKDDEGVKPKMEKYEICSFFRFHVGLKIGRIKMQSG